MRVPKTWIPLLSKKIVDNILSRKLVKPIAPQDKILSETEDLVLDELTVEDRVNEEVRELLKVHASEIEDHRFSRHWIELWWWWHPNARTTCSPAWAA